MLSKLQISGIRSFGPCTEVTLEFDDKLTLILGKNGVGKTTIIECLKVATTGTFPPGSDNGKCFIHDPKFSSTSEVYASIKLKFIADHLKPISISRLYTLSRKQDKLELKKTENILNETDGDGNEAQKSLRVGEMDTIVPKLLGLNPAILQYVSFCHQDESLWPFGESNLLKKIFDQIFCTEDFSKVQETHRKFLKDQKKILARKNDELAWALKQINQDRAVNEKLKKLCRLRCSLQSKGEEIKEECKFIENIVRELKGKRSIWERKEEKLKEYEGIKGFLASMLEYKEDNECEYDPNREDKLRLSKKNELIKRNLESEKVDEIEKNISKNNEMIGKLIIEADLHRCKASVKADLQKKFSEATKDFTSISECLKELDEELIIAKGSIKELKIKNENSVGSIKNCLIELSIEKKNFECEMSLIRTKISDLEKVDCVSLESGIQQMQNKIVGYDEWMQASVFAKESLENQVVRISAELQRSSEIEVKNLKLKQNQNNLLELLKIAQMIIDIVPNIANFKLSDYENYVRKSISELDKSIFLLSNERDKYTKEIAESSVIIEDNRFTALGLEANISQKITELMKFADINHIEYKSLCDLEQKLSIILKETESKVEEEKNQQIIARIIEESIAKRICQICSSDLQSLELINNLTNSTKEMKKATSHSGSSEIKKKKILILLDLFCEIEDMKKQLENTQSIIDGNLLQANKIQNWLDKSEFQLRQKLKDKDSTLAISEHFSKMYQLAAQVENFNLDITISDVKCIRFSMEEVNYNELQERLRKLKKSVAEKTEDINQYSLSKEQCISKIEENRKLIHARLTDTEKHTLKQKSLQEKLDEINKNLELLSKAHAKALTESQASLSLAATHKRSLKDKIIYLRSLNFNIIEAEKSETVLNQCNAKIEPIKLLNLSLSSTKSDLQSSLSQRNSKLQLLDKELSSIEKQKNNFQKHKLYQEYEQKKNQLESDIHNFSQQLIDFNPYLIDPESQKLIALQISLGKIEQEILSVSREIEEIETRPPNSEENAIDLLIETQILEKAINENLLLLKSLESSIIAYHQQKIFQINSIIGKLWSETYKGSDIETISICTEFEAQGKRSSFNYRICFKNKNCDIDMRGRCSSGQRMMASLVIRIALAQAFSGGAAVIALDEPTTNMDSFNAEGLADSISYLAKNYEKLQLIIITHDQDFLRKIIRESPRESYFTIEKHKNLSFISKIKID